MLFLPSPDKGQDCIAIHFSAPCVSIYVILAALSVVGIADFSVRGGSEVAEGVGSGLVWDRYYSRPACLHHVGH